MFSQNLFRDKSYGLLLASIESEQASKKRKAIGYITSEIVEVMKDYYSLDEKKIASYEYIIQQFNFTTEKEKIQVLKLVAEYGIKIDCLKVICNTHYGNSYQNITKTCSSNPGILTINSGSLQYMIEICEKENVSIEAVQRENIYNTTKENNITKYKLHILYQIFGIQGLIHGINTGSLYYIQFITIDNIEDIVTDNPDIHITDLNTQAKNIYEKNLEELYKKNPPTSEWD